MFYSEHSFCSPQAPFLSSLLYHHTSFPVPVTASVFGTHLMLCHPGSEMQSGYHLTVLYSDHPKAQDHLPPAGSIHHSYRLSVKFCHRLSPHNPPLYYHRKYPHFLPHTRSGSSPVPHCFSRCIIFSVLPFPHIMFRKINRSGFRQLPPLLLYPFL